MSMLHGVWQAVVLCPCAADQVSIGQEQSVKRQSGIYPLPGSLMEMSGIQIA